MERAGLVGTNSKLTKEAEFQKARNPTYIFFFWVGAMKKEYFAVVF